MQTTDTVNRSETKVITLILRPAREIDNSIYHKYDEPLVSKRIRLQRLKSAGRLKACKEYVLNISYIDVNKDPRRIL